ncbi:MAG: hypothetical protein M3P13_10030, partial [Acidobacteriota bacterium]|nr:hypothetical protein [Acidobacteriota bacterium]
GTDVTVQKKDGASLSGRLVEVNTEQVVIESKDGVKLSVPRSLVESVKPAAAAERRDAQAKTATATTGAAPAAPAPPEAAAVPTPDDSGQRTAKRSEFREVTVPAGTVLRVTLETPVASDTSHVEDAVRATLRTPVTADGVQALPVGTAVLGHVTSAQRSAKVKGRASIGVRFNTIDVPGDGGREAIRTGTIVRVAPATKKKDATKIGSGAGAGALIGGFVGGGSGAAKGAAIGGGAGTGAVLATRGDEVRLPTGTALSVRLTAPLTVRVPVK